MADEFCVHLDMDYLISPGLIICPKNFKSHFLQDISNSYHEISLIGLEPPKKNFGEKISTTRSNTPQNFDIKGGDLLKLTIALKKDFLQNIPQAQKTDNIFRRFFSLKVTPFI